MTNFKAFFAEQQNEEQEAAKIQAKIKELSRPEVVESMVLQSGAKDVDDLVQKLEGNAEVQRVLQAWERVKNQQTESWIGSLLSGVWNALTGLVKWALGTVANSIIKVFAGFKVPGAPKMAKVTYAGFLLLTLGLSRLLILAGSWGPAMVPWGLLWFGWNFIEPNVPGGGSRKMVAGY